MRLKLETGEDDRVVLPPRDADALGVPAGDEVELLGVRGAFAIVMPPRAANGAFAGTLSSLTVPEVVQTIVATLKTGVLLLAVPARPGQATASDGPEPLRKAFTFREGQLVFASSGEACDRLGAVLWRHGLLDEAELERCSRSVRPGRLLGQVLVDKGVLTPAQLYAGVSLQVREILLGCFLETEGEFVFLEGPHEERNAVKLPERSRDLLLAGLKRIEEVERLRAELPDADVALRCAAEPIAEMGHLEARLLGLVDGRRTVREAIAESALGLYDGLRSLAALLRAGAIAPATRSANREARSSLEEELFGPDTASSQRCGPFETYGRIFKRVFDAIDSLRPDARDRLNSYFERVPEKQRLLFDDVRVDDQGEIDVAQVLVNASARCGHAGAAARARSLEALEDFLAFALFEAKNLLPRDDAEALLREVGQMQLGKS